MVDESTKRGDLIRLLEQALTAAEELGDGTTAYLIEWAWMKRERSSLGLRPRNRPRPSAGKRGA
jgi:hypothetical protein